MSGRVDAAVKRAPHGSVLAPEVVAAIEDLELSARLVVEGMRTGGNRSPFHGYSTEFRQHRPYRAGDDLKYLDWKLFGRSDRLYTRQFRDTTNVPVMLVLDSSGSMDFPAAAGGASVTKFRYAVVLAAALAYLASTQGNAVGLMTMEQGALRYMPARGGRPHLRALLAMLERMAPAARWDARLVIDRAAQLLRRRGLVVVISDFYDDEAEVTRALRRVTQHGHDVSVLHVLSPAELALGDSGAIEYEDIETGERRLVDAGAAAVAYAQRIESFAAGRRDDAVHAGITYARLVTDVPPGRALRDFLQRRGGARGAERIPGGAR